MITAPDSALLVSRAHPVFVEGRFSAPLVEAKVGRELGLSDGQVIQALVQARGDQLGLFLRGRFVEVASMPDWHPGTTLSLRVQVNSDGSMTLHPGAAVSSGPAAAAGTPPPIIQRVENLLFHPGGLPDLQALFKPGVMDALIRALARPDLQAQWNSMRLSMSNVSPEAIRFALVGAMGSEAALARGQGLAVQGPKQLLQQLLLALGQTQHRSEEAEGDLSAQIQRAIDDIESAQVHAVQSQMQGAMMFNLVVPFKDAEPVALSFERQRASSEQQEVFTINIHSNSREHGEVWLKTEVHDRNVVELFMWATQAGVVDQAEQGAQALTEELLRSGITMRSFQVICGARPAALPDLPPADCGRILDTRA